MESVEESFRRGEVVWAKLTGHPWWPGAVYSLIIQVVEVDENSKDRLASTCIVKFFGEDSQYIYILQVLAQYYLFKNLPSIPIAMMNFRKKPMEIRN